jgi:hypothetical protein
MSLKLELNPATIDTNEVKPFSIRARQNFNIYEIEGVVVKGKDFTPFLIRTAESGLLGRDDLTSFLDLAENGLGGDCKAFIKSIKIIKEE